MSVMKKLPSFGFVFLLLVICSFFMFIQWVAQEGWYDKFSAGSQATKNDNISRASYLEKLSQDCPSNYRKAEYLLEAAKFRHWAGNLDAGIADLERGLYFSPDNSTIKRLLLQWYERSGQKDKAVNLADSPFFKEERRRETVSSLLLAAFGRNESDLKNRLLSSPIKSLQDGRTLLAGFGAGQWTVDGKPGFLVVPGFPDQQLSQEIFFSCYAADKDLPITVTIDNGKLKIVHIFHERGRTIVTLPPVQPGSTGLFNVTTDKSWIPSSNDRRKLGVRVQPVE